MENSDDSSVNRKKAYRDLLDKIEILNDSEKTGLETVETVCEIIQKADDLFEKSDIKQRVEHTDEVLLDAKLLSTSSIVLYNVTDAIDASIDSYESEEFARRIRRRFLIRDDDFNYEDLQWKGLFQKVRSILKTPPEFSHMCSYESNRTVEEKPKKAKKRKIDKAQQQVLKKQPEKLTAIDKEEDSVDDTVKFLQWSLNKEYDINGNKLINYFTFTIDPDNFTRTIENCFYLSFLIRDGRVKLQEDKNKILYLKPISGHEQKKAKKDEVSYTQCIVAFNTSTWKNAIDKFDITSPFLSKWRVQWDARKQNR